MDDATDPPRQRRARLLITCRVLPEQILRWTDGTEKAFSFILFSSVLHATDGCYSVLLQLSKSLSLSLSRNCKVPIEPIFSGTTALKRQPRRNDEVMSGRQLTADSPVTRLTSDWPWGDTGWHSVTAFLSTRHDVGYTDENKTERHWHWRLVYGSQSDKLIISVITEMIKIQTLAGYRLVYHDWYQVTTPGSSDKTLLRIQSWRGTVE